MNYLVDISYDGSLYHGWAVQTNNLSVQETIQKILTKIYKTKISIVGSGRTDAGVHALHQYFNFVEKSNHLNINQLTNALSQMLPKSIKLNNIKPVDDEFNARYNAKNKTYLYVINCGEFDLFKNNYVFNYNKQINLNKIKSAIKLFIGQHNFLSFSKSDYKDTVRKINSIKLKQDKSLLKIEINGNGFLRCMVRMIVGSLIDLNENKKTLNDIKSLLNNPKKGKANIVAVAKGLYLKQVKY